MNYMNAAHPGHGEPWADLYPEVSANLPGQVEDGTTDAAAKGKPSVLCFRPRLDPIVTDERRWVATLGLPSVTDGDHKPFWEKKLLQVGRVGGDSIKSGPMLWDKLGLNVSHQLTEGVLNLKNIDDDTARAAQSALIGTFNTSLDEYDLEAAAYALSVFLNSHPLFSHMAAAEEFDAPFGAEVVFELVGLGFPEA